MTMIDRRDTMQKVIDFLKSTDQPVSLSEIVAVLEKRAPERKIREAILELLDTRQAALDDDMRVSTHATAK